MHKKARKVERSDATLNFDRLECHRMLISFRYWGSFMQPLFFLDGSVKYFGSTLTIFSPMEVESKGGT